MPRKMITSVRGLASAILALFLSAPPVVAAAVLEAGPSNYRERLARLQPGDTLLLRPGEYRNGLPVHRLNGQPGRPIVIAGPDHGARPLFLARKGHNTVSIVNASYVIIRNLDLDGRGLPVDGIKCEGHADWAHHITLEGLNIHGHGHNQQTVGISTKCPAWDWVVRRTVIAGAGTGMYFGNSDGTDPFVRGLIEYNLVTDSTGYNLQIKHQVARPALPDMPAAQSHTVIRYNVFSKARQAASGPMARPNVLVGHWPLTGPGSEDAYLIYGNFFHQNPTEALFQGEGVIALYSNVFVNLLGDAIHIQPHNDVPRVVDVFFNTVLSPGNGIRVLHKEGAQPERIAVEGNAVFAGSPISGAAGSNVTAPLAEVGAYLVTPERELEGADLRPQPGRMRLPEIDTQLFEAYPDWNRDFAGQTRSGDYAGAFGHTGAARGRLMLEVMPERH